LKYNDEGLKKQKDLLETHGFVSIISNSIGASSLKFIFYFSGRVVNRLGKNPRRTTQVISLEKSTENEKLLGN
jgi:hypothetical protein